MKYDSIEKIIKRLDEIIANENNVSKVVLGGYIVGCTIVVDGIGEFFAQFPLLEEIAELGSDLEIEKNWARQNYLLNKIKQKTTLLKEPIGRVP